MSRATKEELEKELASIVRVRNRLADTNDFQLPKVLQNLLPRLLLKLDRNAKALYTNPSSLRPRIQAQLLGVLSHALERVRGAPYMSVPWVVGILESLESESEVTRTITMALLQTTIPRSNPSPLMAQFWRNLDRCHRKLLDQPESNALKNEWTAASWICLDAMAVLANMRPKIDWSLINFDLSSYEPIEEGALVATSDAVDAVSLGGVGVFELFLDLFLLPMTNFGFEPGMGMSAHGYTRIVHRKDEAVRWNNNTIQYMNELKFACFQYAVTPFEKGLFQGDHPNSPGAVRRLICIVLLSTNNSKLGRLAADALNKLVGSARLSKDESGFVPTKSSVCTLPAAISMLMLSLGDVACQEILQQHSECEHLWKGVLGHRPTDGELKRSPLPTAFANRCIEFISENFSSGTFANNEPSLGFFLDLLVAVQNVPQLAISSGMSLMHRLYEEVKDCEWSSVGDLRRYGLDAAVEMLRGFAGDRYTLAQVPNSYNFGLDRPQRNDLQLQLQRQQARLQHLERNDRRMVNRLQHRALFMQTRMRSVVKDRTSKESIAARTAAYGLVSSLAFGSENFMSIEDVDFSLPILLLTCADLDSPFLIPHLAKALSSVLQMYDVVLADNTTNQSLQMKANRQRKAAFLLPVLVQVLSSRNPHTCQLGLKCVEQLLVPLDSQAAFFLADHLRANKDKVVAKHARKVVAICKSTFSEHQVANDEEMYGFIDFRDPLALESLSSRLDRLNNDVIMKCCVSRSTAEVILRGFGFNVDKAVDSMRSQRDSILSRIGVSNNWIHTEESPTHCSICFDDMKEENRYALRCNHFFCFDCWRSYLETTAEEGPYALLSAACPAEKCNQRVLKEDFMQLAPSLNDRRRKALLSAFVEEDSHYSLCPGPDCSIVAVSEGGSGNVHCVKCEIDFCFSCTQAPHSPARCSDIDSWNKKFGDSKFWMKRNTKACPGCQSPIEKNAGCNHMTCSRCGHEFCWMCLRELRTHLEPHECNTIETSGNNGEDSSGRDFFFSDRYAIHEFGETYAKSKWRDCHRTIQKLVNKVGTVTDADIDVLLSVHDTLIESRCFLKNTYVLAYNLKEGHNLTLLRTHQGVLENFVDRLSHVSEMKDIIVYTAGGERDIYRHLRMLSFYTMSVRKYMDRIVEMSKAMAE